MPGFFGYISRDSNILDQNINLFDIVENNDKFLQEEIIINTSYFFGKIFRNSLKRFERDKVFFKEGENFYILDGVVLNKLDLFNKYGIEDGNINSLLKEMAFQNPQTFFNEFRGTFAGLYLNKDVVKVYTNHIGDRNIFYHLNEDRILYFATDFEILIKMINKQKGKKFKINSNAAYSLMTHSHVFCNETLLEEVYRLTPGHYINFTRNNFNKIGYYFLNNKSVKIPEDEALYNIDHLFRQAIKRSFDKDLEYGYKHLVALSGGLDSRMTTWVAYKLGYTNMLNYTFSQTDYIDQKVPMQITEKLKTEWIFKALDNGTYLYKYFYDSIRISGGRSQSCTISHTLSMLSNLNLEKYGIIHTGQLGDVILGTFYDDGKRQSFKPGAGAYSKKLINKVDYNENNAFHIEDQELFKFYNRGLTGVNSGLNPMYNYTETISPFLDVDFIDFCLSLPLEYRSGHKIYIKWINKFYPEAAAFTYEKVKGKINRKLITIKGIPVPWTSIPNAIVKYVKNKMGLKYSTKNHMHPLNYWYKNNENLKQFYQTIFNNNINLLDNNLNLKDDCISNFVNGNVLEKDQVITLLGFIKIYYKYLI